jgi:hypothetical protein
MATLTLWPVHTPLWPKAPVIDDPTWSQWLSKLVIAINPPVGKLFADLPPPAKLTVGEFAVITDSNTVVWGAVVAGGGANQILAWWTGAAWTVIGRS